MDLELKDKVAIVTGGTQGIGKAAALRLAAEGARVVIAARGRELLDQVAGEIRAAGGSVAAVQADVSRAEDCARLVAEAVQAFGRLDILVNNAGANVLERSWAKLNPERIKTVIDSNLTSTFYCAQAALALMRPQKDGLLIHTASWAGRFVGVLSGPGYVAAKHGVVAMSYEINMEEFMHGIRSTVLCPNEVATPILDKRPVPVSAEDRAKMIQPEHMADLIVYVAKLPASICLNEVVISPTWNRGYAALAGLGPKIA